jgi:hypothetical protein
MAGARRGFAPHRGLPAHRTGPNSLRRCYHKGAHSRTFTFLPKRYQAILSGHSLWERRLGSRVDWRRPGTSYTSQRPAPGAPVSSRPGRGGAGHDRRATGAQVSPALWLTPWAGGSRRSIAVRLRHHFPRRWPRGAPTSLRSTMTSLRRANNQAGGIVRHDGFVLASLNIFA